MPEQAGTFLQTRDRERPGRGARGDTGGTERPAEGGWRRFQSRRRGLSPGAPADLEDRSD